MSAKVNPRRVPRTEADVAAAECVADGYVTWAGVRRMLKEYNVEVELV